MLTDDRSSTSESCEHQGVGDVYRRSSIAAVRKHPLADSSRYVIGKVIDSLASLHRGRFYPLCNERAQILKALVVFRQTYESPVAFLASLSFLIAWFFCTETWFSVIPSSAAISAML